MALLIGIGLINNASKSTVLNTTMHFLHDTMTCIRDAYCYFFCCVKLQFLMHCYSSTKTVRESEIVCFPTINHQTSRYPELFYLQMNTKSKVPYKPMEFPFKQCNYHQVLLLNIIETGNHPIPVFTQGQYIRPANHSVLITSEDR